MGHLLGLVIEILLLVFVIKYGWEIIHVIFDALGALVSKITGKGK